MWLWRSLARLAAASVLVSACSASAETTATEATEPPAPISTTAGTFVASTTTSTESSTPTTAEAVEVLLPANDVDDPTEAIVAISDFYSFLFTAPQLAPDFLDVIYLETCDCYDTALAYFHDYMTMGWRQDDDGITVTGVVVSQKFENGNTLLQVTDSWSPQYVVNGVGDRIRLLDDEWLDVVSLIGLERGPDGRWRVGAIGVIGEVAGSS